jgi:predicted nucleic acid-binding protein
VSAKRIVVDTPVLCELLRAAPAPAVLAWFAAQAAESLFVSAITQAEVLLGARHLQPNERRNGITAALDAVFAEDFADRVLPFDAGAMAAYADIYTSRRAAGHPITTVAAQIAGTARHAGACLATRDTAAFEGCGVAIIDPWAL